MILTDGTHLVSDKSHRELHAFAKKIGLKREWFQDDHYDLTSNPMFFKARAAGAEMVASKVLCQRMYMPRGKRRWDSLLTIDP